MIHALVGVKIINTIREELPELFDEELETKILQEAEQAFISESQIIDWMVNGIDEKGLTAPILKEFIKNRINESLVQIGFNKIFDIDENLLEETTWFDEELMGSNMTDFFDSRPVEYSKNSQNYDEDELF
jgi:ribonucleoside-diphosphate reductase beta chain